MNKTTIIFLILIIISGCAQATETPRPAPTIATTQPALIPSPTFTSTPTLTGTLVPTQTAIPTPPPDFCVDIRGFDLINSIITAVANKDDALLASLVSPSHGMDVMFYRDEIAINFDREHVKFIFETTFEHNWGISFGSGEPTLGSFQDVVLPTLEQVFTPNSLVVCGQLQTGGATYFPEWPYPGMNYYSVYFPGTDEFGGLDWQTWAVRMDIIAERPYIAALVHYVWEP